MVARFSHPLDYVRVAAPCPASWERMVGNDRVRFCDQCNLNVYNLSALTKREAERLIMSTEGRLCVRFYRRADGTILTQNCPTGLRAIKRRVIRLTSGVVTAVLSFFGSVGLSSLVNETKLSRPHTTGRLVREAPTPFNGPIAAPDSELSHPQGEAVLGKTVTRPIPIVGRLVPVKPRFRRGR